MKRSIPLILGVVCSLGSLTAQEIQFNRHIRPILSENCLACHGPDRNSRVGGLRLDLREAAVEAGAIHPGDPAASKLVARINAENQALRMPPARSGKKLTAEQKRLLAEWIEQGAVYQGHWAYRPPQRPEAPAGPAGIDYLVNLRLREKGLAAVGEADRRTLARRVSLDLTGLPPEPAEVEAFLADTAPDAWARLVDRYLASPQFGERMAVHWLDLVRYADTTGYHGDQPLDLYLYRDYVIRAFNRNQPFDRFTVEQLAGDLLPDATPWQQVAAAYNRLNRVTNEGGSQAAEYMARYASDRVRNLSEVWLGSTLACAECHDHKFDPFLTRDFYQLASFFADIEEEGVYRGNAAFGPSIRMLPEPAQAESDSIGRELAGLRADDGTLEAAPESLGRFAAYLRDGIGQWQALEPVRAAGDCSDPDISGCDKFELRVEDGGVVQWVATGGEKTPGRAAYALEYRPAGGPIRALQLELLPSGRCQPFFLSEFEVRLLGRGKHPARLRIEAFVADREQEGSLLRHTSDGNHHTHWKGQPSEEGARRAVFVLAEPVELGPGESLLVTTVYNSLPRDSIADRLRVLATGSDFPQLPAQGALRRAALADGAWTEEQRTALEQAFLATTRGNPHWRRIAELERRQRALEDNAWETLITRSVEPRPVRVLPRGNWMDDSGEIVEPQVPHFLETIPGAGARLTRLDLARWLVSRENPLTARVFVNRLWKMFFGTGLSKVLDDLGSQGEPPVNPDLLDWLAVEFRDSGWDIKHTIRTILLSETYRRSSLASPELREADPLNRLLARQSALRLDAEFIRDSALAVSGLLNPMMGGPSAKPYQPARYYEELNFPKREYQPDLDGNQHRRGVYTHWQRLFLHPSLLAFDAPPREECAAQRTVSNTPLQSLVLLNDPTYVEAARAFAARLLRSGPPGVSERIDFAFRLAFARPATEGEAQELAGFLESQRRHFQQAPQQAGELLGTGIAPLPGDPDRIELAAWTSLARALLNKHEFLMRY